MKEKIIFLNYRALHCVLQLRTIISKLMSAVKDLKVVSFLQDGGETDDEIK